MATFIPQYLNLWKDFETTIKAPEVRGEFLNLYEAINGNLDADNIKDGAVTSSKIATEAVTNDKIKTIEASKITGQLSGSQLPSGLVQSQGGEITGSLVFNTPANTAYLKSFSNSEIILAEIGTGTNKITITVNPGGQEVLRILKGTTVLLSIGTDGALIPKKLQLPVV